jgi:hypothetical protein
MPSSGVSLLAMTRVLITGCRALASRLRSPNWPGTATVGVDAYLSDWSIEVASPDGSGMEQLWRECSA